MSSYMQTTLVYIRVYLLILFQYKSITPRLYLLTQFPRKMIIYNSYISKHIYCFINSEAAVFGRFHFKRSVYIFLKILCDHFYIYCIVLSHP